MHVLAIEVEDVRKMSLRGPKGRGNLLRNEQERGIVAVEIAAVATLLRNDIRRLGVFRRAGSENLEKSNFSPCNIYWSRVIFTRIDIKGPEMSKKDLELFDSEWAILRVVWRLEPCAAPTVQEELQDQRGWAYTTVKTMMDRMVAKGLLKTKRIRNLYLYSAAVTEVQARRNEIMRAVKRAFDGTLTPMMQFLIENDELSDE